MKHLITILLLIGSLSAFGQIKRDTDFKKEYYKLKDSIAQDSVSIFSGTSKYFIKENCRDSIVKHVTPCLMLAIIDRNKPVVKWIKGYQCWDEKIRIGNCYIITGSWTGFGESLHSYYYLDTNKKPVTYKVILSSTL